MILRKPYAFLIKNFKLLHVFLTLSMAFIFYKTINILRVFNDYFSSQVALIGTDAAKTTYTFMMFLLPILIIIISLILWLVMAVKKKPSSLYIITIAVYVFTLVMFFMGRSTVLNMEINVLDVRFIKMTRDLTTIAFILQFYPMLKSLVRAVGFDIKEFDFGKDLEDLKISEADSEEFEVSVSFNKNKVKRKLNSKKREFKYIYKENKVLINTVVVIAVSIIGTLTVYGLFTSNKKTMMNTSFTVSSFSFKITDAYITRKSYDGNYLNGLAEGMSVVIIPFKVKNISLKDNSFLPSNVILQIGEHKFKPIIKYRDSVADIAPIYNGEVLPSKQDVYKAFMFEVPTSYLSRAMYLKFVTSLVSKGNGIAPNYLTVPITAKDVDNLVKAEYATFGTDLELGKTVLGNTLLNISSIEIGKRFKVNYNYTIGEEDIPSYEYVQAPLESNTDKVLLKISYTFIADESKNLNSVYDVINRYGSLKYNINGTVKLISNLVKVEPSSTKLTKTLFVQAPKEIEEASEISLMLKIRNMEYTYKIK